MKQKIFINRSLFVSVDLFLSGFVKLIRYILLITVFLGIYTPARSQECALLAPGILITDLQDPAAKKILKIDVRSTDGKQKGKIIPRSFGLNRFPPIDRWREEFVEKYKWKGRDVVFIGEDIKSEMHVCRQLSKYSENIGLGTLYVLDGGLAAWQGPVVSDREYNTKCELTSKELWEMREAGNKMEFLYFGTKDEFDQWHVPGATLFKFDFLGMEAVINKWEQGNIIGVLVDYDGYMERKCHNVKYYTGYEKIYTLKGGMKAWEEPVEKNRWQIMKKKVKGFFE